VEPTASATAGAVAAVPLLGGLLVLPAPRRCRPPTPPPRRRCAADGSGYRAGSCPLPAVAPAGGAGEATPRSPSQATTAVVTHTAPPTTARTV
jgi:hypothetical protein